MKISDKRIGEITQARQSLRLMFRPINERRKELRNLWFTYYIWMFNIIFVVGFMSYGIIMFMETNLFLSVVLASGLSYLVGMTLHSATCRYFWKEIQKLNNKEEK